ncbi:MAG: phosphoglycerate dehydrogenase [Dehalococcoidia bacterium]
MNPRVLVADPIAQDGIDLLDRSADVDVRTGLSLEALLEAIPAYDALVVRSETKVTAEVIDAGTRLQVIGRAGVGVDNIDIPAATRRGIVVVNAPTGNTISAAEHTIGLMLALARHIPQADASMRAGEWQRSRFVGVELRGKILGVIGLGQVGSEVARRARGLDMCVLSVDPFVSEERARSLGVELVELNELLGRADFIAVHTTLTQGTRGLIGAEEIAWMKPTVRLINTARGGIIEEAALVEAVRSGRIAGAAVDVFTQEPLQDVAIAQTPGIIVTPHLGASTAEAQERVAVDVAEQILRILAGEAAAYAVNAPLVAPETMTVVGPFLPAAELSGSMATQLSEGQLQDVEIIYNGELALHDTGVLRAAVIRGLLRPISEEHVTIVNANLVAESRGLRIVERKDPEESEGVSNLITVRVRTTAGGTTVSSTVEHGSPRIVQVDDLRVDLSPAGGYLLFCHNQDRPGMIGAVGMKMRDFDINISSMKVGRRQARGRALMVLELDEAPTEDQLREIAAIPDIFSARLVRL